MPTMQLDIDASGAKRGAAQAETALNKVKSAAETADNKVSAINKSFTAAETGINKVKLAATALGGVFAALSVEKLFSLGTNALNFADELNASAQAIGISAEALQSVRGIFQGANVGIEQTDSALKTFTRNIGLAAEGSGPAKEAFENLGISLQDAAGNLKDTDTLFNEAADAISKIESTQKAAAEAGRLFGREVGTQLVPALSEGSKAFIDLREKGLEAGSILSNELVQNADDANSKMEQLRTQIGNTFKGAFIKEFVDGFGSVNKALGDNQEAFRVLGEVAGKTLNAILQLISFAGTAIEKLKNIPSNISSDFEFFTERLKPGKLNLGNISSEGLKARERQNQNLINRLNKTDPGKFGEIISSLETENSRISPILHNRTRFQGALEFGGFRAGGGPVSPDKYYVVGESGPELFVPKEAGSIVSLSSGISKGSSVERLSQANNELKKQGRLLKENSQIARIFSDTLSSTVDNLIGGFQSGRKQSFGTTVKSFGLNLLNNIGQQVLLPGLTKAFSGFANDSSGSANDLSGNTTSSKYIVGGGFDYAGNRASGGRVRRGKSYLVGEYGPEIFTPGTNGAISNGGSTVVVNIQAKDAQSFAQSKTQIAAAIAGAVRQGSKNL